MGTTAEFARFIYDVGFQDLPKEAISKTKELFLDTIGVSLLGSSEVSGKIAIEYAREVGGNPEASVFAAGLGTSVPMAAFTNGLLAHNLDYDDWVPTGEERENWPRNGGHVSGVLVPVALALGEKFGLTGKAMIEAYVLGVEVYAKIAANCPNLRERGWHSMPVYGCLAAVATAAKLLALDVRQIDMAFGIVASAAAGLFVNVRGYMANPFHSGNAARAGVEATLLARRGFTGHEAIIETPTGFCDSFLGKGVSNLDNMSRNLGKPFYMVSPGPGIKPYPCAWPTFYAIDGVLELVKEHNIGYEDVEEVEISVSPYHYSGTESMHKPEPVSGYDARFSTNFACGNVILKGNLDVDDFTDSNVRDEKVKEAIGKVKLIVDQTRAEERGVFFAPVLIKLKDGREFNKRVDICKGHPKNPLTSDELLGKYRRNAGRALSEEQIGSSIQMMEHLEELENAQKLMSIVAPRATG